MKLIRLILRNAWRQKTRTVLTLLGMAVAILAHCLLQTVVEAWYSGVAFASPDRLVVRNAVSLVFPLPVSYYRKIMQVPDVKQVTYANWFGGIYIDERHFFPRMAVKADNFFSIFPEFVVSEDHLSAFHRDRNACIAGRKLVEEYRWKLGDTITLTGNIYPGQWRFVLRGIYRGARETIDETQFFFRWDYLDETLKKTVPARAGKAGWYVVQVRDPSRAAAISKAIDAAFKNSSSETITETEKAFQLGFVAMTEAIVIAIRIVSYVVIVVILLVMANTMAMTARERMAEYAVLKTLGFGNRFLTWLIAGESAAIAMGGGLLGIGLTFPTSAVFVRKMGTLLPVFHIRWQTLAAGFSVSCAIGLAAAVFPVLRATRASIAEGLGHIG